MLETGNFLYFFSLLLFSLSFSDPLSPLSLSGFTLKLLNGFDSWGKKWGLTFNLSLGAKGGETEKTLRGVMNWREKHISLPIEEIFVWGKGDDIEVEVGVEVVRVVSEMHKEREKREGDEGVKRSKRELERRKRQREERRKRERKETEGEGVVGDLEGHLRLHFKGGAEENKAFLFGVLAAQWFCGVEGVTGEKGQGKEKKRGGGVKEVLDASFGVPPEGVVKGVGALVGSIRGVEGYKDFFTGLEMGEWGEKGWEREVGGLIKWAEEEWERGMGRGKTLDPVMFVWRKWRV